MTADTFSLSTTQHPDDPAHAALLRRFWRREQWPDRWEFRPGTNGGDDPRYPSDRRRDLRRQRDAAIRATAAAQREGRQVA